MNLRCLPFVAAISALAMLGAESRAEPYLAIQQGYKCVMCHVNPAGGGMRNEFGNIFAQNVMPARRIDVGDDGDGEWTGLVSRYLGLGGNLRSRWTMTDVPNEPQANEFEVEEARLYLLLEPVPGRLALYVDERLAPGSALNLEAYVRYRGAGGQWFVQAGQMYLPFGLRIEDDSAFTRRIPGINMTTPDDGVQVGLELEHWSAQLAVSNGSGGGPERDSDKQFTGQATYVDALFRVGLGASVVASDAGDRRAYSAFAGARTGPIAWLGELALIEDAGFPDGTRTQATGLIEANWLAARGHNLKLTAEWFDPDRDVDEDDQARWSLVYEFAPIQFVQLRVGARFSDGIPQNDLQNLATYFIELHGFF